MNYSIINKKIVNKHVLKEYCSRETLLEKVFWNKQINTYINANKN